MRGMERFEALDTAAGEFAKRLRVVTAHQWSLPTPCSALDVRQLVAHVVGGNRMATILLKGGSREESLAPFQTDVLGAAPVEAFNGAFRTMVDAMKKPGALDQVVHHPMGDIPAAQLCNFRIADLGLHAWDLAQAIGVDGTLNASLVELLWEQILPMKDVIAQTGVFGTGPSGTVAEDAPLQTRLLDLTGRRP